MNIFIIARGYPSKKDPHWGCFENDQAEALANLGHKITILSVDARFRFYWRPLGIQHKTERMVSIYNIFLCPYALLFFLPKQIKRLFYNWQLDYIYKRAVRQQGEPDILYSHYLPVTQRAISLRKKYNIPLVAIEHWSELAKDQISTKIIHTAKQTYNHLDQLIAVSQSLKDNIIQKHLIHNEIKVVPNLLGKEFTYQSNNTKHPLTIVSAGRLVPSKRFDLLIDAVHQIQASLPNEWKLLIIGGGCMKTALQEQINTLHLQEHIQLLGQQTKAEIVRLFQHSDFFALPSQMETFGVVYIEALACGLPIIATNCGGPSDIIMKENGILIPNKDIDALKEAILHMSNNLKDYNRENIAKDCQARFAPEVIAKRLTTIFEETIKTHKEQQ